MRTADRTGRQRCTEPGWLGRHPLTGMDIIAAIVAYLGCVSAILTAYAMSLYLVFAPADQAASVNHKATPSAVIQKVAVNPHKRA